MLGARSREIVSGIALFVGSSVYLHAALQYRLGSATRMGPGYFPMLLGTLGIILAIAIVIRGMTMSLASGPPPDSADEDRLSLRPFVAIAASVIVFAATIHWMGLLVAVAASVIAAAAGDKSSTLKGTLLLAVLLAAGCWLIFVYLLGLNIPVLVGVWQ